MKNRKCPTTAVFPFALLTQRRTRICDFIIFPRNKSKKFVKLPKFTETREYFSQVSARCISARRITRLAKMQKGKKSVLKKDAVPSIFQWSSKKRSRTTLRSKGKCKVESLEEPRRKRRRKNLSAMRKEAWCHRETTNWSSVKKKTAQLKELGDKENQKREHASALKEDKLDAHVCFSVNSFREKDKYIQFYTVIISWDVFLHLFLAM